MFRSLHKRLKRSTKNNNNDDENDNKDVINLSISDCTCPICLEILIEPVDMPCKHEICLNCFETMLDKTNLYCPMCRLRISTWARQATKNHTLINEKRWNQIKMKFSKEISQRIDDGQDKIDTTEDQIDIKRAKKKQNYVQNGEIRKEYLEFVRREEERRRIEKENEEKLSLACIEQVIREDGVSSLSEYMQREQQQEENNVESSIANSLRPRINRNYKNTTESIDLPLTPIDNKQHSNALLNLSNRTHLLKENSRIVTRSQSLRRTNTRASDINNSNLNVTNTPKFETNNENITTLSRRKYKKSSN